MAGKIHTAEMHNWSIIPDNRGGYMLFGDIKKHWLHSDCVQEHSGSLLSIDFQKGFATTRNTHWILVG